MSLPRISDRDDWRSARIALLEEEKAMTRARDRLSTARRELPMVAVDADHRFRGPDVDDADVPFIDLFEGRRQLIVQHFMFDPSWEDGCASCTAAADELSAGLLQHLHTRDTTFAAVSRAPLERLLDYKRRRGWSFPWYSSFGSMFNYDFHVSIDATIAPVEFNFRGPEELRANGLGWLLEGPSEQPGYSMFLQVDGRIFHTYSTFARGGEWLGGSYAFLDLTALGRQEEWEEPKGRSAAARAAVPDFST